jgi:hypothetical protein
VKSVQHAVGKGKCPKGAATVHIILIRKEEINHVRFPLEEALDYSIGRFCDV